MAEQPKPAANKAAASQEFGTITYKGLKESHGSQARAVYNNITNAMGLGTYSADFLGKSGKPSLPDIDTSGAKDDVKEKIAEILKEGKK